jgi:hypothetical protein
MAEGMREQKGGVLKDEGHDKAGSGPRNGTVGGKPWGVSEWSGERMGWEKGREGQGQHKPASFVCASLNHGSLNGALATMRTNRNKL